MLFLLALLSFGTLSHAKSEGLDPTKHYQPTAAETVRGFSGWGESLQELNAFTKPNKSYVFWILSLPEIPLDLRSAEFFRRMLLANPFFAGGIGHNIVAWKCSGSFPLQGSTGMSGESYLQTRRMLKSGFGLTSFFSTFTDGFLETSKTASDAIEKNAANYGLITMGFEVSASQCENLVNFAEDFANHPAKPYLKFGFVPNPLKMEGGGCVNFAMALLEKAGIWNFTDMFYRNFKASKELFGGGLPAPEFTTLPDFSLGIKKQIEQDALLSTPWLPGGQSLQLRIMDPELMIYALKIMKKVYFKSLPQGEALGSAWEGASLADRWVTSGVMDREGIINPRRYRIDSTFDAQTARVGTTASSWMQEQLKAGKKVVAGKLMGSPLLLIENP